MRKWENAHSIHACLRCHIFLVVNVMEYVRGDFCVSHVIKCCKKMEILAVLPKHLQLCGTKGIADLCDSLPTTLPIHPYCITKRGPDNCRGKSDTGWVSAIAEVLNSKERLFFPKGERCFLPSLLVSRNPQVLLHSNPFF